MEFPVLVLVGERLINVNQYVILCAEGTVRITLQQVKDK